VSDDITTAGLKMRIFFFGGGVSKVDVNKFFKVLHLLVIPAVIDIN